MEMDEEDDFYGEEGVSQGDQMKEEDTATTEVKTDAMDQDVEDGEEEGEDVEDSDSVWSAYSSLVINC